MLAGFAGLSMLIGFVGMLANNNFVWVFAAGVIAAIVKGEEKEHE